MNKSVATLLAAFTLSALAAIFIISAGRKRINSNNVLRSALLRGCYSLYNNEKERRVPLYEDWAAGDETAKNAN